MKKSTIQNRFIEDMKVLVKRYNCTPQNFRYVCRRVRSDMGMIIPKKEKPLPDYLNPAEIYKLLDKSWAYNTTTGLICEFLIFTGLRISELLRLRIINIDFSNNQLKVVSGKGHKDRYVPITNNLLSKVRQYIEITDRKIDSNTILFVKNKRYNPFTVRAVQIRITNIIKSCEFSKELSTHSLRHTFACLCLARGMRLEDIQLMLGHTSIKTTQIYAKLELASIKEKYLQLMEVK